MQSARIIFKGFNGLSRPALRLSSPLMQQFKFPVQALPSLTYISSNNFPKFSTKRSAPQEVKSEEAIDEFSGVRHTIKTIKTEIGDLVKSRKFNAYQVYKLNAQLDTIASTLSHSEIVALFGRYDRFHPYFEFILQNFSSINDASKNLPTLTTVATFPGLSSNLAKLAGEHLSTLAEFQNASERVVGDIVAAILRADEKTGHLLAGEYLANIKKNSEKLQSELYVIHLHQLSEIISILGDEKLIKEFRETVRNDVKRFLKDFEKLSSNESAILVSLYTDIETNAQINELIEKCVDKALQNLSEVEEVPLTELITVLPQLGYVEHERWDNIEQAVLANLEGFDLNQLSVIISSFARVGCGSEDLFMEVDRAVGFGLNNLFPHDIPVLVEAFATSGLYRQKFFSLLAGKIEENVAMFSAEELTSILWSYSTTHTISNRLFTILETELTHKARDLGLHEFILVVQSLNIAGYGKSPLLDLAVPYLREMLGDQKNYGKVDRDDALSLARALGEKLEDLQEIVPGLLNFFTYQLRREGAEDKVFLLELGEEIGQTLGNLKGSEELVKIYLLQLRNFRNQHEAKLTKEDLSHIQFLNVNLAGSAN